MKLLWTVLILLGIVSLCQAQITTLNLKLLEASLDVNGDGNITMTEVDSFYTMLAGTSSGVTRCQFLSMMVNNFMGSPRRMSALYDVMQIDNGQVLSRAEIMTAFLGNAASTMVSLTMFRSKIDTLMQRVTNLLAEPNEFATGPNFWNYQVFEAGRLGNDFDLNDDGIISREEITTGMRKLDSNSDYGIRRCEFVDVMTTYKEHAVTANKMYDVIFKNRDVSWADVDSDFLLLQMNRFGQELVVTKQEFIDFFTTQNTLAAGLTIDAGGKVIGDGDGATVAQLSLLCIMSSFIAFLMISKP